MNDMTESMPIKEKLNLETAIISWKDLQLFFAQGKLLIVNPDVDLVDVATIIANNNVEELEQLINRHHVEFANPQWINTNCEDSTLLWAVVVSPYVLAQLKPND